MDANTFTIFRSAITTFRPTAQVIVFILLTQSSCYVLVAVISREIGTLIEDNLIFRRKDL